jgi:signal transduction histidine kinase
MPLWARVSKRLVHMPHSVKTLRILSIENSSESYEKLVSELEKLKLRLISKQVSTITELKTQLKNHPWNLVISNYHLGGFDAGTALEVVRSHSRDLPFLLLTESIGEEIVVDMMKAGIEDVVMKSRLERLNPAVRRILREHEIKEKEARAHKLANEAFAAKEQMLAIVSHDIKNPLSAIQLEAQMLLRAAERAGKSLLAEEVKIQSNRILKTTDRLKILISDLLDKNKTENGLANLLKNNIDCMRLLQEVLDAMRPLVQEKQINLRTVLPTNAVMSLDRNKMFQVFSNLINNAIKFTPVGGTIQISLEEYEHEFIFSVDDSGPGLKDKELNKVFEKYWTGNTTDCVGTGLGLFICKTIVEAHGGHIFVENTQGGARFRFSIPKVARSTEKNYFAHSDSQNDQRKKIYIVDDDEDLREVISWALGKEGYAIHSFSSPNEALDCLKKGRNLPHLIVVDFHMDEMQGSEFVLKKSTIPLAKACPVVMISASPQEVEREIPHDLYREIITKPIDLEGLVDNIRKFLN